MKHIDPIKLLQEKAARDGDHPAVALGATIDAGVPYEIPLEPPAGARVERMTIASTYRKPIPVLYDRNSRTTYPVSNKG